jgi:predicted negative regulator of RcsB-dependent stress response
VRAQTRHQLKQDRFSQVTIEAAERTMHWTVEHRSKLVVLAIILIVVVGAAFGSWYYYNQRDEQASLHLSEAIRTYNTPVRPAGMPAQPDQPSFASAKERAEAAHKQFKDIVDNYPHTHASQFARYFEGLTAESLGDHATAERDLKDVASSGNDDLSSLAKMGLASVYRDSNRTKDAIDLYNQVISHPTQTVSKVMAQMELASTYQANKQPDQAKVIYQQIQKENPNTDAAQIASTRLAAVK